MAYNKFLHAARSLARQPEFTLPAVSALALGIAANVVMFSLVHHILLRALPYPDANRLVMVYASSPAQGIGKGVLSVADFIDVKNNTKTFADLAAYIAFRCNLPASGDSDGAEQVICGYSTAGLFTTLGANPLAGRLFQPGDDDPGKPGYVVLSEGLWRRRYHGSQDVIGEIMDISGTAYTIVGVAPASFKFPQPEIELWVSISLKPQSARTPFYLRTIGKLLPGQSTAQAAAELRTVARNIERAHPETYSQLSFPVVSLLDALVGDVRLALLAMQGAVVILLLVALANVANLSLARGIAKERELAIRTCIGASPWAVAGHLLMDSALVAGMGALLGLVLGWGGIFYLKTLSPRNLPRLQDVSIDGTVVLFTTGLAVVSALVFGLYPAIRMSQPDLAEALKSGGRGGTEGAERSRLRGLFVVLEIAMSVVLLVGGGLMIRSFLKLTRVDLGFTAPAEDLVTMQVYPSDPKYTKERRVQFYRQLISQLSALHDVKGAAISASLPPDRITYTSGFEIEGRPVMRPEEVPLVPVPTCSPGFFETMGIPLIKGRYFTSADNLDSPPVVIVSQALAQRYFPNGNAIGKRIRSTEGDSGTAASRYMEIVGVVGDARYRGASGEFEPVFYQSADQQVTPFFNYLVVRGKNPGRLISRIKAEVRSIDKGITTSKVATMDQLLSDSVAQPRLRTLLTTLFAIVALALAAIGTYGVMAHAVTQRTHEIGIRMALGALPRMVLVEVLREGLKLALFGTLLGSIGALFFGRLVKSLLFGITPNDPLTYSAVFILLLAVATLACYMPARRAIAVDPALALREG